MQRVGGPDLTEPALDRVVAAGNRGIVRRGCLVIPTHAAEQVRPDRVEEVVVVKLDGVDECQGHLCPLHLRHGNGAVESDDGRWCDL